MGPTWIAVAHRAGARIFETRGRGTGLKVIRELDHEVGRLKNSEIDADRLGASGSSTHIGQSSLSREESSRERVAANFARELARELERGRNEHAYKDLVLVAEPRFLGMLRESLDGATAQMVSATVNKDLANVAVHDLPPHIREAIVV